MTRYRQKQDGLYGGKDRIWTDDVHNSDILRSDNSLSEDGNLFPLIADKKKIIDFDKWFELLPDKSDEECNIELEKMKQDIVSKIEALKRTSELLEKVNVLGIPIILLKKGMIFSSILANHLIKNWMPRKE